MKAPSAPTLLKCRDCGGSNPRVVTRGDAHEWLCASCEYKRSHPDAAPNVPLPRERRPKPFAERAAIRVSVPTVAALYVDPKGAYANLPGVEVWDEARDARTYGGPWPVVAHPPCAKWSPLAYINQRRIPGYLLGDDGGCFAAALEAVNTYGGVLEHPANSVAWRTFGLTKPEREWWLGFFGSYVTEVDQGAYGHRARKRTWLYVVAPQVPPALDWTVAKSAAIVSGFTHQPKGAHVACEHRRVRPAEANATPPAFRDVLLAMARSAARYEVCA